ncbi:SDR family oxidoreductase, partial [candidate division WWE3 bacterium]|nr:SDR family oxidoreductase [candidate division WWE3 bacterium]
ELSKQLDQEGANLILVGRNFESKDMGDRHVYVEADLTSEDGMHSLRDVLTKHSIDVLINMAGVGIYKPLEELTSEEFYVTQMINLMVPFLLTKIVLEKLKESDIGLVLNIGSGAGTMPFKNRSAYCASKYGLRGLSLSLSEEYEGRKPRFCLVTLGSTMTTFGGKSIESQEKKAAAGNAIFPVEYVAKELIEIIKDENREPEIVLYPSEHGFGEWKKPL